MEPLANRIRPQTLDEFVGQTHLVGAGKPLRLAIEQKHIFSFVLWGTPGIGKTTLARIYANALSADFYELSAVSAGKEDIRKIVKQPREANRQAITVRHQATPVPIFRDHIDHISERSVIVRVARAGYHSGLSEILGKRVGLRIETVGGAVRLPVAGQVFRFHCGFDADDAPLMPLVSVHNRAIRSRFLIIAACRIKS